MHRWDLKLKTHYNLQQTMIENLKNEDNKYNYNDEFALLSLSYTVTIYNLYSTVLLQHKLYKIFKKNPK